MRTCAFIKPLDALERVFDELIRLVFGKPSECGTAMRSDLVGPVAAPIGAPMTGVVVGVTTTEAAVETVLCRRTGRLLAPNNAAGREEGAAFSGSVAHILITTLT
jgi:hypothetical protein